MVKSMVKKYSTVCRKFVNKIILTKNSHDEFSYNQFENPKLRTIYRIVLRKNIYQHNDNF